MKFLIIVIGLFFLSGCYTHNDQEHNQIQEDSNLDESKALKKISNIVYTDYIDGTATRIAMVTNGFEVQCRTNRECGGACGRRTASDEDDHHLICCPSGYIATSLTNGKDYCTEMPDGSSCWTDAMCADGHCSGNDDGFGRGICGATSLPVGATCSSNSQCKNHACGRKTAAKDAPLICCESGVIDTYAGYDYCTKMPNGSSCWSNNMCSSGYCKGNIVGFEKGTCSATDLPVGASCSSDGECKNKACGRKTAAKDAPLICCYSGETDLYGGYDYCTEMPKGSICWSDAMCKNGDCQGNDYGIQRGTCN